VGIRVVDESIFAIGHEQKLARKPISASIRIVVVSESLPSGHADLTIDARGQTVMPGFIDGHVHHVISSVNFVKLQKMSQVEQA